MHDFRKLKVWCRARDVVVFADGMTCQFPAPTIRRPSASFRSRRDPPRRRKATSRSRARSGMSMRSSTTRCEVSSTPFSACSIGWCSICR